MCLSSTNISTSILARNLEVHPCLLPLPYSFIYNPSPNPVGSLGLLSFEATTGDLALVTAAISLFPSVLLFTSFSTRLMNALLFTIFWWHPTILHWTLFTNPKRFFMIQSHNPTPYPFTSRKYFNFSKYFINWGTWLAQWVKHVTLNLGVASLRPMLDKDYLKRNHKKMFHILSHHRAVISGLTCYYSARTCLLTMSQLHIILYIFQLYFDIFLSIFFTRKGCLGGPLMGCLCLLLWNTNSTHKKCLLGCLSLQLDMWLCEEHAVFVQCYLQCPAQYLISKCCINVCCIDDVTCGSRENWRL